LSETRVPFLSFFVASPIAGVNLAEGLANSIFLFVLTRSFWTAVHFFPNWEIFSLSLFPCLLPSFGISESKSFPFFPLGSFAPDAASLVPFFAILSFLALTFLASREMPPELSPNPLVPPTFSLVVLTSIFRSVVRAAATVVVSPLY